MEKIILHGVTVYTNNELKKKLKSLIQKKGSSSSKDLLIKLVDDNMLVPVINEPSKLKQLIMKIRKKEPVNTLGTTWKGVGYVIFHEGQSPKITIDTALHEVIHIAHRQTPNNFNKINMSIFVKFYSYFYKELFQASSYDEKLFSSFLKKFINGVLSGKMLIEAFEEHTKLSEKGIDKKVEKLFELWDAIDNQKYYTIPNSHIIKVLLRKTYRKLFKSMDYQTGVGQEIINQAEIICVLSTINPEHPNVIKSLKLIKPGKKPVIDSKARIKIVK